MMPSIPMFMVPVLMPMPYCMAGETWASPEQPSLMYVPTPTWASMEQPAPQSTREDRFSARAQVPFAIKNSFVEVDESEAPARKRRSSCPARLRHVRTTVMLSNLPNRAQEHQVRAHVATLGADVQELTLPMDKRTGVNRGYAFCKFDDEDAARDFIALVEGTQIEGSKSKKRLAGSFANGGRAMLGCKSRCAA